MDEFDLLDDEEDMQPALEATFDVACQPSEAATPAGKQPAVQPLAPAAEPQQAAAGEASPQHPAPVTSNYSSNEDVTMATGSVQDSPLPAIGAEALDSDSRVVASHSGPSAAAAAAATGPAPPMAAATRALKTGAAAAEGQPASVFIDTVAGGGVQAHGSSPPYRLSPRDPRLQVFWPGYAMLRSSAASSSQQATAMPAAVSSAATAAQPDAAPPAATPQAGLGVISPAADTCAYDEHELQQAQQAPDAAWRSVSLKRRSFS
ncbi:hypothetical protein ABPG77_011045 [Micractinium sp. CCAP 211/92]